MNSATKAEDTMVATPNSHPSLLNVARPSWSMVKSSAGMAVGAARRVAVHHPVRQPSVWLPACLLPADVRVVPVWWGSAGNMCTCAWVGGWGGGVRPQAQVECSCGPLVE